MNLNYAEIFATPEQLAEFCMLDPAEQAALLAEIAPADQVELSCSLIGRKEPVSA